MEVEEMAPEEGVGGKGFVAQEREERNQALSGRFYRRGTPRPRPLRRRPRGRKATVVHSPPGEKFKAPTPFDSRARRTRALISQAKRPIRPVRDGTAVSSPHAPSLKRCAPKSHVRAVPSRASGARPKSRRVVYVGRKFRLARPLHHKTSLKKAF